MKTKEPNAKQIIISVIILLTIISTTIILIENPKTEVINTSINSCPNFNGRAFLLTGGSRQVNTIQEISIELSRVNWLCNGAPLN